MRFLVLLISTLLWPGIAAAHGSIPGAKGFYIALAHPLTIPGSALFLLVFGLFVHQRLPASERAFITLCAACLGGLAIVSILRFTGHADRSTDFPLCILAAICGLLVAGKIRLAVILQQFLGVVGGLLVGAMALPDPGPLGAVIVSSAGAVVGSMLIVLLVAGGLDAVSEKTRWHWLPIASRVAGSWVVAIATMVSALVYVGKA